MTTTMHARRPASLGTALALAASAWVFPVLSQAQSEADQAARRLLLSQAQGARDAGRHAEALDLASRAARIQSSAAVRRFVAEERMQVGQLAEALGDADQCLREADAEPPSGNRTAVINGCRTLVSELQRTVGRLVVRVPSPAPEGLTVTVNGRPLSDAFWGVPYVVTPGRVEVVASAPGFTPMRANVDVASGREAPVPIALTRDAARTVVAGIGRIVVRDVPAGAHARVDGSALAGSPPSVALVAGTHSLEVTGDGFETVHREVRVTANETTVVELGALVPDANGVGNPSPNPPSPVVVRRGFSPVGPVLLGAGAVVLVGGLVTWFVADGRYNTLASQCPTPCSDQGHHDDASTIHTLDTVANVGIYTGAAVLAAGAVLLFVIRPAEHAPASPSAMLTVDPTTRSIGLVGAF